MTDDNESSEDPNEMLIGRIEELQRRNAEIDAELEQVMTEYANALFQLFPRIAAGYEGYVRSFEEFAVIQPQLKINWDTLSEPQREAIIQLDTNFKNVDKMVDPFLRMLSLLRGIVSQSQSYDANMQQATDDAIVSIRNSVRSMHEIATQLGNDLEERI